MLWTFLSSWIHRYIKPSTKPTAISIAAGSLFDLTRSRTDLLAENAMLRQQLIVLKRQVKRPKLTNSDRIRLLLFARCTKYWTHALHIIQPNTLLRWHRELFRHYWRRKSKSKQRKPRVIQETIDLIKQMAKQNPLWGAARIRGELLKLGIKVCKRTVQRHMPKAHKKCRPYLGHLPEESRSRYLEL